jgi:hypothetical protein
VLPVVERLRWRNPHTMSVDEPRRLALEVRFDAEPIQGRLYDEKDQGRLDRPFLGWLGLMSALEAARCGDQSSVGRQE